MIARCRTDGGWAFPVSMGGANLAYRCMGCKRFGEVSSSVEHALASWNEHNPQGDNEQTLAARAAMER